MRANAFSLVEVTLALGVVAFAFVSLFALLPIGLGVSREAIDNTVTAQIAQQLATQAQQTDFSKLSQLDGAIFYFNEEGGDATASDHIYKTHVAVPTQADPVSGKTLPITTLLPHTSPATTQRIATVKIYILNTRKSGREADPARRRDPLQSADALVFTCLAPDNGL